MSCYNYYEFDFEGELETHELDADLLAAEFFTKVATELAMADLTGIIMKKIIFRGREWYYMGWQPGMLFEFQSTGREPIKIWLPELDH